MEYIRAITHIAIRLWKYNTVSRLNVNENTLLCNSILSLIRFWMPAEFFFWLQVSRTRSCLSVLVNRFEWIGIISLFYSHDPPCNPHERNNWLLVYTNLYAIFNARENSLRSIQHDSNEIHSYFSREYLEYHQFDSMFNISQQRKFTVRLVKCSFTLFSQSTSRWTF